MLNLYNNILLNSLILILVKWLIIIILTKKFALKLKLLVIFERPLLYVTLANYVLYVLYALKILI